MFYAISYVIAGLGIFAIMVGFIHLPEFIGGVLIGGGIGSLITATILFGIARTLDTLRRIERKLSR